MIDKWGCVIEPDVDGTKSYDIATNSEMKRAAAAVMGQCMGDIPRRRGNPESGGTARGLGE